MYRTKKDVDKHVESLITKLSVKEFKTRAYSVARLYFEVGDYANCQRYVEQYLSQKDNNAAAHKLLGQALQKLGQKEKALEQFKTSLDIDPTQTSTILDICELLADDELAIDPARAKYWYEKAEAAFPRHPMTFRLQERLVTIANPDPEALVSLLTAELAVRPKDAQLHARLIKHYLNTNQIKEAFDHSCNVEFGGNSFLNNYAWYDNLTEMLKHNLYNTSDWIHQLLLLTVRERICLLSLTETPTGSSKSLVESNELLHAYDQALEIVAKAGAPTGFGEFHASLLQHHRGQFAFHSATFLLKKAKKDQLSWRDATRFAAPLMLIAWQTVPLDSKVNWLMHSPEKQKAAVHRWYTEGNYRCSQSGHYLLSNIQEKSQSFLDRVSQCCSGAHWRDKLYEIIFTTRDNLAKIKTSHFASNAYSNPVLRLPRKIEVEAYDGDAQQEYANSLHHFVWILLNYKNYAHFRCTVFDMLTPSATNSGLESLNNLDIHAFLYCAALTTHQKKSREVSYLPSDKPSILPANITDLLCPLSQMKWWDCAYKFSQNELGTALTDIRATLSHGIEVVRCIDNHGLDPELLCVLGSIFSERSKLTTAVDEKTHLEIRAGLYYSSALPLLEKLKSKITIKMPEKRLFDYTHKDLGLKELNSLIEESKLYIAINCLNDGEYEKVIEMLSGLKSPQAYYHLSQTYKKIASEEKNTSSYNNSNENKSKYATLLLKAKTFAFKALDRIKEMDMNKNHPLYSDTQQLVEDIEIHINKIDPDLSANVHNDMDGKYSSDENISSGGSEHVPMRNNHHLFRNLSSTPKQPPNSNATNYRTAVDSQMFDTTRIDTHFLERIENQIKNFQKRLTDEFEENRRLGLQIMSTIQCDMQNTTDQFKLLKISVDQVTEQVRDCKNDCKDIGDIKKQIGDLKKEINKLKKASSEQTVDETGMYNLEDDYRTSEGSSTYAAHLPFQASQVMPPFNQRLVPPFPVPPNPYQLYSQNLYNLYNQYSQFAQTPSVPGAPPLYDPTRGVSYPGMYPTPDQMYLDVANLVPPTVPAAPTVPAVPVVPAVPNLPAVTVPPSTVSVALPKPTSKPEAKEVPRSLPVNVVITSSDPLPTCTTTPAPVLSVTIPPKHIKGTPHNYQIQMPTGTETNAMSPVFNFPSPGNKVSASTGSPWNQSIAFRTTQSVTPTTGMGAESFFYSPKTADLSDNSRKPFTGTSPNANLNKSRTLSERSNTSADNYDPCPDFKPIIPLPAEVTVTTGEEDEAVIFSARAKLFRFVDKQWKERGIGEMKLLRHKTTGKVRVLMRREQIHKICANHIISPEMEITPMKNETKAYFWFANDFADETVVLEKFCIRFKTADIAKNFYETFEKVRLESKVLDTSFPKSEGFVKGNTPDLFSTHTKSLASLPNTSQVGVSQQAKTQFGGFTFSSTPTFKTIQDNTKTDTKPAEPITNKVNVFSTLTFKTTTSSSFGNIFATTVSPVTNMSSPAQKQETPSKRNNLDVEEFEPNIEFKPVVPLPALIDQKTGEEDETVLFEHRAKLLRYDVTSKEWKERGLGNIKLLMHKENNQKIRLLMRREQIMKVCCNHAVTKEMTFQKMPNMDKAVTWCAKDYSENELVTETFCLRFKTVQACDDFIQALKTAQSYLKDESKSAKDKHNIAKENNQVGFGDKFKTKPGSWYCEQCYTNNLENFDKCACCEQPKPRIGSNEISSAPSTNWGDKFKPKLGSWECKECLIRNEANVEYCGACNSPKDPTMAKKEIKIVSDNAPKFNFGIPANITNSSQKKEGTPTPTVILATGWGDKFKAKEGTWECKQCFVRNESNFEKCSACDSWKDPNANKNEVEGSKSMFSGSAFSFGIPQTATDAHRPKTETSIFDGTGAHKFSFGNPLTTQENVPNVISFGDSKPLIFGTPKLSATNHGSVDLSTKKNIEQSISVTPNKPALLPTPKTLGTPLGGKEGGTFNFVLKSKSPTKGKSPVRTPKSQTGDDSDANEYASDDEGVHIHFSPVIPMPDKVDVVTGEENETELYGHRAKLFRFTSGEWKERGIGVVKILKHKDTGKLRVVMRREQVLKICLNHALTPDIAYTAKDEKTWLFAANDFSDGELSLQQFCLRFKTKEIASDFKDAVDKARAGKSIGDETTKSDKAESDSDDVVFVSEMQATNEEKQRAEELMLPENFFTYKNNKPCAGCRGCTADNDDDDSEEPDSASNTTMPSNLKMSSSIAVSEVSTPVRTLSSSFQSTKNSFYGTPADFGKSFDTSVFRTPLGSIGSNTNSASPMTSNSKTPEEDATNKENTDTQKSLASGFLFATPQNKCNSFGDIQASAGSKNSILAAPKLSAINTTEGENQSSEPKSIFGAAQAKLVFGETKSVFGETKSIFGDTKSIFGEPKSISGEPKSISGEPKSIFGEPKLIFGDTSSAVSSNKSVFDFAANSGDKDNSSKVEVPSIFGAEEQKPVNLFTGATPGSIFGPGALANTQQTTGTGVFGSAAFGANVQSQPTGGNKLTFGNASDHTPKWSFGGTPDHKKTDVSATNVSSEKQTEKEVKPEKVSVKAEPIFNVENTLTFADFSPSGPGFAVQNKPDFRWEGAGQQLFVQKTAGKDSHDKSKNDSGAGDVSEAAGADEEYDPHYEPIVPLPDKIVVTTGEEDEEKMFGERCKLFRYDDKSREWKERGVGEMKILYHPMRKTYRLLLRREQVHKAVLNMLIFMDLELLPMKNSDRAWTWAGRNFAESTGDQETLAVRFKSVDLATAFHDKVVECVRKLQSAAAQAIKEEKEPAAAPFQSVAPLRLPKHLQDSARADSGLPAGLDAQVAGRGPDGGEPAKLAAAEVFKQVHFQEPQDQHAEYEDEEYEHDYDNNDDYDAYYNEEEEDAAYSCEGEAVVQQGDMQTTCQHAHILVLFDQDTYTPKIQVTDSDTGEILADMLIHTDTEFQMTGNSCSWAGIDYTSNDPVDKTVTINFYDSDTAMQFYDSCETSKAATYSSTDPES